MIPYLAVLLFGVLQEIPAQSTLSSNCCPWKTVKNSGTDVAYLNGFYKLKEIKSAPPEDVCGDSCVYVQVPSDGYEYCFKNEASESEVYCEVK